MIVGIPKESMRDERRVVLTPAGAYALTKRGHKVIVQSEAGIGCSFSNEAYREAGANIAFSPEEIFARADLIVKVMPPTAEECNWMTEGKYLLSVVHLGTANPQVHQMLREKHSYAIGIELIEDSEHTLPILPAMSEIAGILLPQIAGRFLETTHGGRGVMLGGVAGVPASNVLIIGAGTVGSNAARIFLGYGTNVTVMDDDLKRLHYLEVHLSKMVNTVLSTPYNVERYVTMADVIVGSAMIHGRIAPHVVTESMVKKMRPGSVILDLAIDHGGCIESSHPTTLSDPVFKKHGVTHYCVPNIPSSVARTASHAFNNALLSFIEAIADSGTYVLQSDRTLRRGVYIYGGHCTHEGLADLLNCAYVNPDSLADGADSHNRLDCTE
jgi:alanine dehydrogenase